MLGVKLYVEGNEEELTGSGVGLNTLEELVLEGDGLDTVEVLVLEDCLLMYPGFHGCACLLGQSRPEQLLMYIIHTRRRVKLLM